MGGLFRFAGPKPGLIYVNGFTTSRSNSRTMTGDPWLIYGGIIWTLALAIVLTLTLFAA